MKATMILAEGRGFPGPSGRGSGGTWEGIYFTVRGEISGTAILFDMLLAGNFVTPCLQNSIPPKLTSP